MRIIRYKYFFSNVNHSESNVSIEQLQATLFEMIGTNSTEHPHEHPFKVLPYDIICYSNTEIKHTYELVPQRLFIMKSTLYINTYETSILEWDIIMR